MQSGGAERRTRSADPRAELIWGDKKYVLPSLLPEFAGQVNLIYIDPPFDTGADFSFTATVPDDPATPGNDSFSFIKAPSIIEHMVSKPAAWPTSAPSMRRSASAT